MELCAPRALSKLPRQISFNPTRPSLLARPSSLAPKIAPISLHGSGSMYVAVSLPKARTSDDTSVSMSDQFEQASDEAVTAQDVKLGEVAVPVKSGKEGTHDEAAEEAHFENEPGAAFSTQENILDVKAKVVEFLNDLNIKLGSGDAYTILGYGSSATLALWISSAVVNAIDSIPLFPKVMEVVGLIFTIWFSYRYLIFKKSRDELVAKFEELKDEIIG